MNEGNTIDPKIQYQVVETFPRYTEEHLEKMPKRDLEGIWKFMKPFLQLQEGMVVGDIGCGTGNYSFLMAQTVGPTGKVVAVDVQERVLQIMRERSVDRSLNPYDNISIKRNQPDDCLLAENLLDAAVMINVHFHYFPDLFPPNVQMMQSVYNALKPGARLIIMDGADFLPKGDVPKNIITNYRISTKFELDTEPVYFPPTNEYILAFRKPITPPEQPDEKQ